MKNNDEVSRPQCLHRVEIKFIPKRCESDISLGKELISFMVIAYQTWNSTTRMKWPLENGDHKSNVTFCMYCTCKSEGIPRRETLAEWSIFTTMTPASTRTLLTQYLHVESNSQNFNNHTWKRIHRRTAHSLAKTKKTVGNFCIYLFPLFQNKSSCRTFHVEMSLPSMKMTVHLKHFHMNGFAQRFVLT